MNYLAINLRILRDKKNMTQAQVSEQLQLGEKVLSNYENGKREPDYDILMDLADFYEVSLDELLRANKDTKEYCEKLQRLSDEYLHKGFSEMIADSDLWKKYQNTIEEREKAWKEHIGDQEWAAEQSFGECDSEARYYEATKKAMEGETEIAKKEFEELLSEGKYDTFFILLSIVNDENNMDESSIYCDEISRIEEELELIEKVSVYCAIAHNALSGHLNDIFNICSGGYKDED